MEATPTQRTARKILGLVSKIQNHESVRPAWGGEVYIVKTAEVGTLVRFRNAPEHTHGNSHQRVEAIRITDEGLYLMGHKSTSQGLRISADTALDIAKRGIKMNYEIR